MPRTKLTTRYEPKTPPIDWLRAAILERQAVLGYDLKDLSVVAGISYEYMRKLIRVSPWNWPAGVRGRICDKLGVRPIRGVEGMPLQGELYDL